MLIHAHENLPHEYANTHIHTHTDGRPLLLILLLVFDFSGNRVLTDLTIVDKTTLSTPATPAHTTYCSRACSRFCSTQHIHFSFLYTKFDLHFQPLL